MKSLLQVTGVFLLLAAMAAAPANVSPGEEAGGVTVYHKMTFNESPGDWAADNDARLGLSDDAVDGKALEVVCAGRWSAAQLPIRIAEP